jgi:hypothetical protein
MAFRLPIALIRIYKCGTAFESVKHCTQDVGRGKNPFDYRGDIQVLATQDLVFLDHLAISNPSNCADLVKTNTFCKTLVTCHRVQVSTYTNKKREPKLPFLLRLVLSEEMLAG